MLGFFVFSQTVEAFKLGTLKRGHWFSLKLDLSIALLYLVIPKVKAVSLSERLGFHKLFSVVDKHCIFWDRPE